MDVCRQPGSGSGIGRHPGQVATEVGRGRRPDRRRRGAERRRAARVERGDVDRCRDGPCRRPRSPRRPPPSARRREVDGRDEGHFGHPDRLDADGRDRRPDRRPVASRTWAVTARLGSFEPRRRRRSNRARITGLEPPAQTELETTCGQRSPTRPMARPTGVTGADGAGSASEAVRPVSPPRAAGPRSSTRPRSRTGTSARSWPSASTRKTSAVCDIE